MSYPQGHADPLFESLNPLVKRGSLSPAQADEVYRAVSDGRRETGTPAKETVATGWHRPRLLAAVCVLGVGLMFAAVWMASITADGGGAGAGGASDDFNWKSFVVMGVVSVLLAAAAAASYVLLAASTTARLVTSVLAAIALLSLVVTVVSTWDADALVYLGGLALLLGGVGGYWFVRGEALIGVAILGGVVLLGQLLSDTIDGSDPGSGTVLTVGMIFLAYGLVVAAAGWRFSCRTVAAMLGLGLALVAMWLTVVVIGLSAVYLGISAEFGAGPQSGGRDDVRTDARIAMVLGLLVAVGLVLAYVYTTYPGYLVLAFLGAALLPSTTAGVTMSEHPIRWATAFAVIGAAAAAVPLAMFLRAARPQPSYPPHPGPPPPGYPQHG